MNFTLDCVGAYWPEKKTFKACGGVECDAACDWRGTFTLHAVLHVNKSKILLPINSKFKKPLDAGIKE